MVWVLNATIFQFSQYCYWIFPFLFDLWSFFLLKLMFENLLWGKHCCVALSIFYLILVFPTTTLWGIGVTKNSYVYYALIVLPFLYLVIFLSIFLCHYHSVLFSFQEKGTSTISSFSLFLPVYFSRWTWVFYAMFQKESD